MIKTEPRYSTEEFARRGGDLFERLVKPRLTPEDDSKFVAIDIESGDFDIDEDEVALTNRMMERKPDVQLWLERVGWRGVHHIGGII